ncbi:nuclear transport factor 2 family protein [soil metagenome]
MPLSHLQPAAAAALATWHQMIAARDLSNLPSIIDPHASFRSPMAHTAYESAAAVVLVLETAFAVFENFTYHRELATDDGLSVVLEFSATIGDRALKGIDLIRFSDAGKIIEFEVMVRPMSGLEALGTEMAKRVGQTLPGFKAK